MISNLKLIKTAEEGTPGNVEQSNPLRRSIPDPADDSELIELLARDPFRSKEFAQTLKHTREITDNLRSVVVPTPQAMRIAQTLLDLIHNGYNRRDPSHPSVWSSLHKKRFEDGSMAGEMRANATGAMTIFGITGTGKSHAVMHLLSNIPQTVHHEDLGGHLKGVTQIVWLCIEMGATSGVDGLLMHIFAKIDAVLKNTNYEEQNRPRHLSVNEKLANLIAALSVHFCGVLVFDEVQKNNFGKEKGSATMRGMMLKLVNSGIPVVMIGNPGGLQFSRNEREFSQVVRRLNANGSYRLDPADSPYDENWQVLVRGLWRCQFLPEYEPLTPEHMDLIYRATGGFPEFLLHFLSYSQELAIRAKSPRVTLSILREAGVSCPAITSMQSLIRGMVERDPLLFAGYEDVDADYYQRKWQRMAPAPKVAPAGVPGAAPSGSPSPSVRRSGARRARASIAGDGSSTASGTHLMQQVEEMIASSKKAAD